MDREAIRLIGSRDAAQILCVDSKVIYKLWNSNQLDFWCINGTMKTNRAAIDAYLEHCRNMEQASITEQ